MSDSPSSDARPAPQVPSDLKAFNRKVIEEYRATGGKLTGMMAGRTVMLLTTTGARSHQARTVVVGYGREGDRYIVIASANGAPKHPAWYTNLVANPEVVVEVRSEKFPARARTTQAAERERLKPLIPFLEREQTKTTREIPLVVLEPIRD